MSVEQNKATLLQAVARFNEPSERPAYFDLYANDAILHGYSGVEPGIDSIKQFYVAFWAAFPDASVTVAHLIGEEDYVACCFTLEGTQTGEYLGIPATGQCVSVERGHHSAFRCGSLRRTVEPS